MQGKESIKQQLPLKDQVYSRTEYAKASFWDDRYLENGGFFDWYAEFPELRKSLEEEYGLQLTDRILMVGCGNSKLSEQMYQAGYHNIVNIDISPTVIQQMADKFPHMEWEVMDATNMKYPEGSFDCVLDKGTLDALISGKNFDICREMLKECGRVVKSSGQIILITYSAPEGRRKIFEGALDFQDYDFYWCRANLNDTSTLINLMRGNMPGKKLGEIIRDQKMFQKTMREFAIIKMLRKTKKYQRQYIIWKDNSAQTKIEISPDEVPFSLNQEKE